MRALRAVLVLVAVVGAAALVLRWTAEEPLPDGGLARIEDRVYTADELAAFLGRPALFGNRAEAESALEAFVEYELVMTAASAAAGATLEPSKAVELLLAREAAPQPVTETEIESYYEENRNTFVAPAQVRLAYFVVPHSGNRTDDLRLLESLRIQSVIDRRPAEFFQLLRRDHGRAHGGEVGPLSCAEATEDDPLPDPVIRAGCSLDRWELSGTVETDEGLFLVRKTAEVPPRSRSLGRERPRIRAILEGRAREAARKGIAERLRREADVYIPESIFAQLVREAPERATVARPARPPQPPGMEESTS